MPQEQPRFRHDCAGGCLFLGRWHGKSHETSEKEEGFDLYWHPYYKPLKKGQTLPDRGPVELDTWIARYGDAGPDYISSCPPRLDVKFKCSPWKMAVWTRLDG